MSDDQTNNRTYRSYEFTLNNWTWPELECLKAYAEVAKFMIIAKEVGEEGTPHLQGRVIFTEPKRITAIKKIKCFERCHLEKTNCNALDYFYKEDKTPWVMDNRHQGERTDLLNVAKRLREDDLTTVMKEFPRETMKYPRGMETLKAAYENSSDLRKPVVIWIHGDTGVGKTRAVFALEGKHQIYMMDKHGDYWNPYQYQKVALMDDFRIEHMNYQELLRLWDIYPVMLNVKGCTTSFKAERIYITCDKDPNEVFSIFDDKTKSQLLRRIHVTVKVSRALGVSFMDGPYMGDTVLARDGDLEDNWCRNSLNQIIKQNLSEDDYNYHYPNNEGLIDITEEDGLLSQTQEVPDLAPSTPENRSSTPPPLERIPFPTQNAQEEDLPFWAWREEEDA